MYAIVSLACGGGRKSRGGAGVHTRVVHVLDHPPTSITHPPTHQHHSHSPAHPPTTLTLPSTSTPRPNRRHLSTSETMIQNDVDALAPATDVRAVRAVNAHVQKHGGETGREYSKSAAQVWEKTHAYITRANEDPANRQKWVDALRETEWRIVGAKRKEGKVCGHHPRADGRPRCTRTSSSSSRRPRGRSSGPRRRSATVWLSTSRLCTCGAPR